jgi:hypothetical protein
VVVGEVVDSLSSGHHCLRRPHHRSQGELAHLLNPLLLIESYVVRD